MGTSCSGWRVPFKTWIQTWILIVWRHASPCGEAALCLEEPNYLAEEQFGCCPHGNVSLTWHHDDATAGEYRGQALSWLFER